MGDPIRKPWLHHLKPIPLKPNLVLLVFTTKTLPFWDVSSPSNPNRTQLCLAQFKKKLDHPRNRGLIHQGYQPLRLPQKNSNDSLFRCPKDSVVDFQQNIIGKIGKDHVPISQYSNFPVFCFHWEKNHQQIQLDQRTHFFFGSEVQRSTYQGS